MTVMEAVAAHEKGLLAWASLMFQLLAPSTGTFQPGVGCLRAGGLLL